MYRQLFKGVPTKPIIIFAPIVIAVVMALYYHNQYKRCTVQATLRNQLYSHLKNNINQTISLTDTVSFSWDRAFVLVDYKPDRKIKGCPFEWDWSEEYRNTLIDQGLLNVIFYTLNKKRVNYVEFSNQRINIQGTDAEEALTPDTAKFSVKATDNSNQYLLLKRVEVL